MTIVREYKCNLCGEKLSEPQDRYGARKLIGLHWSGNHKIVEAENWREVEHHICVYCLSSLQEFKSVCSQGYRGCSGSNCTSDHK